MSGRSGLHAPLLHCAFLLLAIWTFTAAHAATLRSGPAVRDNDSSCDISVAPAATLLLPYFEVAQSRIGETTIFTVTNVTNVEQIARVTLWTDLAYPVITFDIYLTGYDVQSVNLHDVIVGGRIGSERGTGRFGSPEGERTGHNARLQIGNCGEVPAEVDASVLARMQSAFSEGRIPGCKRVGYAHANFVGYATIDVVRNCVPGRGPTDPRYWTEDILFDNVLIGDSAQVNSGQNFAQGTPMVHIRAVPDGGSIRARESLPPRRMPFDQTFYGRFQDPARPTADGRQPLPSTFAVRWITSADGGFQTFLKVWRDAFTGTDAPCSDFAGNNYTVKEIVAFDEDENGEGIGRPDIIICCLPPEQPRLPSTSRTAAGDEEVMPQVILDDAPSGWLYFNLDQLVTSAPTAQPRQAWISVEMHAEGRYAVSFDAAYLGNGCSPSAAITEYSDGVPGLFPGPAEDLNP